MTPPKSDKKQVRPTIWAPYRVRWDFITKLCGQVPADPEMREAWIASRTPTVRPPGGRSLEEINEEVVSTMAETEEAGEELGGLLVFQRQKGVLCMRYATIKAHLKDCARFISSEYVGKIKGEKSFAVRFLNGVYPDPKQYWVPILSQTGGGIIAPNGRYDKAVHVQTRQGPRSAIKTIEFVDEARMEFKLYVMMNKEGKPVISEEDLSLMMEYGGMHGYAGERGDGEGRYTYTIEVP